MLILLLLPLFLAAVLFDEKIHHKTHYHLGGGFLKSLKQFSRMSV